MATSAAIRTRSRPTRNTSFPPFGAFGAVDPDINSPRSAAVERHASSGRSAPTGASSVSYLGSYSDRSVGPDRPQPRRLSWGWGRATINGVSYPVCTTTANLNNRRVLSLSGENPAEAQYIGTLDLHTDVGTQDYHGLKLSAQRRAASRRQPQRQLHAVALLRRRDDRRIPAGGAGFTNPDDPEYDRGHCDQDRTHLGNVDARRTRRRSSRTRR